GMVFVKNTDIVDEKYFTINPPVEFFDPSMSAVHGLSQDILLNSPNFAEIWFEIESYFNANTLIIAHNAQFDMNVLRNCLNTYELTTPNFYYACSIPISGRAIDKNTSQSLDERTKHFGITMEHHHNALSDARACAELVIASIKAKRKNSIQSFLNTYRINKNFIHDHKLQKSFKFRKNFEKVKISDIVFNDYTNNENHPLYKQAVVFTGSLSLIDRKTAMQNVADIGGIPRTSVSRRTNYVVVGMQDISLVGPTGKSTKHRKAEELIDDGHEIKIIDEQKFLQLLNDTVMNT